MKPRLVSDGTPQGTHVYDAAGHEIQGISAVELVINAGDSTTELLLQMVNVEVDANVSDIAYSVPETTEVSDIAEEHDK